jgi:hypothetical protein
MPISAWARETHPTAKPAAWGCRARSLLVGHQNEFGWSLEFHFAKKGSPEPVGQSQLFVWFVAEILICLFGCCDKLIWWELVIFGEK